jgi:hypothetical protein
MTPLKLMPFDSRTSGSRTSGKGFPRTGVREGILARGTLARGILARTTSGGPASVPHPELRYGMGHPAGLGISDIKFQKATGGAPAYGGGLWHGKTRHRVSSVGGRQSPTPSCATGWGTRPRAHRRLRREAVAREDLSRGFVGRAGVSPPPRAALRDGAPANARRPARFRSGSDRKARTRRAWTRRTWPAWPSWQP